MRSLAIPLLLLAFCPVANAQPAATEVIAKFRKAVGGDKPLDPTPYVLKTRGQLYLYSVVDGKLQGKAYDFDRTVIGYSDNNEKFRTELEMKIGIVPFRSVVVLDGKSGWYQMNDSDAVVLNKDLVRGRKERATQFDIGLGFESFDSEHWQLSKPKSAVVRGQETWELDAKTEGLDPITLFFDKQSGLLLRLHTNTRDYDLLPGGETQAKMEPFGRDVYFHEWKKLGSRMFPGHADVFQNGVLARKIEFVGISLPKTIDAKLFAKPEVKP